MTFRWVTKNSFAVKIAYWWSIVASFVSLKYTYKGGALKQEHQFLLDQAKAESAQCTIILPAGVAAGVAGSYLIPRGRRKILVLDLDETLVSSTTKPRARTDMVIKVLLGGLPMSFYVRKRPYVDIFLTTVCQWYEVIIFTASLSPYADPVIDRLDPKRKIKKRLYRQSCLHKGVGTFVKDLSVIESDLSQVLIVDNSPVAYSHNIENAVPISDFLGEDSNDKALLELLPFLDALRNVGDVRSVLKYKS